MLLKAEEANSRLFVCVDCTPVAPAAGGDDDEEEDDDDDDDDEEEVSTQHELLSNT